jgi:vacuolar protein sorting-associated protein 45
LTKLLENPKVSQEMKLKLVGLYALRYEKLATNATESLINGLKAQNISEEKIKVDC